MSSVFLCAAVAACLAAASPHYILARDGEHWFRYETRTGKAEPVAALDELRPRDAVITTDGRRIAFISDSTDPKSQRLFALQFGQPASSAKDVGNKSGRHAEPSFSADGETIWFSHHPQGDGAPGFHSKFANAQLYSTKFSGVALRAHTEEQGCHLSPSSTADGKAVYLIHTYCHDGRAVMRLDLKTGKSKQLTSREEVVLRALWTPEAVIYAVQFYRGARFVVQPHGGAAKTVATLDSSAERIRLWPSPRSGEFYLQNGNQFLHFNGKAFVSPELGGKS